MINDKKQLWLSQEQSYHLDQGITIEDNVHTKYTLNKQQDHDAKKTRHQG